MKLTIFYFLVFMITNQCLSPTTPNTPQTNCPETCECNSTEIYCSGKGLRNWPSDISTNVTTLLLDSNRISQIPDGQLSRLTLLTSLKLEENKIINFETDVPSSLQTLNLNGNNIKTFQITNNDSTNLKKLQLKLNKFKSMPALPTSLEYLDLEQNQITSLKKEDLVGMANIKELNMKSNRLTEIANDTFDELTNLEVLDISLNKITELHSEWFLNKPNLRVVEVRTYKLNCDCELLRVYDELINHGLEEDDLPQIGCYSPDNIRTELVKDIVKNKTITNCQETKTPREKKKSIFHKKVAILAGILTTFTVITVVGIIVWWYCYKKPGYAVV